MRPLVLAILMAGLSAGSALAKDNTVAGLSLGMSLDDVQKKLGSDYTLIPEGGDGDLRRVVEVKPFEAFALMLLNDKVVYIYHYQGFTAQTRPSVEAITPALNEKYGPPSSPISQGAETWMYDPAGRQVKLDSAYLGTNLQCNPLQDRVYPTVPNYPATGDGVIHGGLVFPINFSDKCSIIVQYWPLGNDNMAVSMEDNLQIFNFIKKKKQVEAERQRAIEAQNKPHL